MALDRQIRAALAEQKPQDAWLLARQHLDFQYMPAEMLLQIAKLAQLAQSSDRALAIVQRALQSFQSMQAYTITGWCLLASFMLAVLQRPNSLIINAPIK